MIYKNAGLEGQLKYPFGSDNNDKDSATNPLVKGYIYLLLHVWQTTRIINEK